MVISHVQVVGNYNPQATSRLREMLTEVDVEDNVIGPVTREECHNETRKPWHRGVHLYLFDINGNLFLSQRSKNADTAPMQWTVSAGGHVKFGRTYLETINDETKEELGIAVNDMELIDKLTIDYGSEREVIGIFAGFTRLSPKVSNDSVEQVKDFVFEKIVDDFNSGKFDLSGGSRDTFKHVIENGLLKKFRERRQKYLGD